MEPGYLHLLPGQTPPHRLPQPFRAIIVAERAVNQAWRIQVAEWLVECGCLYVVAWGTDCESWHDSVDWAILEVFDYGEIPDERFVMTTWHEEEPLSEAFWFAGHCALHPDIELGETIIVHVAETARGPEILQAYRDSQETAEDR